MNNEPVIPNRDEVLLLRQAVKELDELIACWRARWRANGLEFPEVSAGLKEVTRPIGESQADLETFMRLAKAESPEELERMLQSGLINELVAEHIARMKEGK